METKKCSKCGVIKPLDEFHKRSSRKIGVSSHCKQCQREKDRIASQRRANRTDEEIYGGIDFDTTYKTCSVCKQHKPLSEFGRNRLKRDGFNFECTECHKTMYKHSRIKNKQINATKSNDKGSKICTSCGTEYPLKDFFRDNGRVDGRQPRCKKCVKQYRKEWESKLKQAHNSQRYMGRITATWEEIKELYEENPHCYYCKKPLTIQEVSIDHKEPINGEITEEKTRINNLAICCWHCNRLKWNMNEIQFRIFVSEYKSYIQNIEVM